MFEKDYFFKKYLNMYYFQMQCGLLTFLQYDSKIASNKIFELLVDIDKAG